MESDLDTAITRNQKFFESLTDGTVDGFRDIAAHNVRYRDPLMDAKGIDAVLASMHKWFRDLDDVKFEMKGFARDGQVGYQNWLMTFRVRRLPKKLWRVDGMSKVTFNHEGKIEDQVDYWDASPLLESVPVMGKMVTLIKKFFQ